MQSDDKPLLALGRQMFVYLPRLGESAIGYARRGRFSPPRRKCHNYVETPLAVNSYIEKLRHDDRRYTGHWPLSDSGRRRIYARHSRDGRLYVYLRC